MTARKRFITMKAPAMIAEIENKMAAAPAPSINAYMTSTQPSSVMDWKMVTHAEMMLSNELMP